MYNSIKVFLANVV